MKLLKSLSIVCLSVVGMISAMNIDTGKELPIGSRQPNRSINLEKMPALVGCIDFVNQAADQLQKLASLIQQRKDMLERSKFTKDGYNKHISQTTQDIKNRLEGIRTLLDKAEKEAPAAL